MFDAIGLQALGLSGPGVAALIRGNGAKAGLEGRQHGVPGPGVLGKAVQEQDQRRRWIARCPQVKIKAIYASCDFAHAQPPPIASANAAQKRRRCRDLLATCGASNLCAAPHRC